MLRKTVNRKVSSKSLALLFFRALYGYSEPRDRAGINDILLKDFHLTWWSS
ncbi:hypothetical protein DSM02_250 [Leeuwenhoekiella polynyae]|uniref:Uncharacterized protein n=1 Tax=Leeuwenhoekiella polynyae TaxID=1550906 RepID=A0A4Q0PH23_9FLAO|nr:hypothetical protein DSM02_250 [Leeuwenhoekiella polynyae]